MPTGVRHAARHLLLCLPLLAGAWGVAAPAAAAVLISNLGQPRFAQINPCSGGTASTGIAQQFSTGTHKGGYTLDKIALGVSGLPTSVTIQADLSGVPGTVLYTLNNPDNLPITPPEDFTAPAGAMLAANTSYWVVITGPGGCRPAIPLVYDTIIDDGAAQGWELGPRRYFYGDSVS